MKRHISIAMLTMFLLGLGGLWLSAEVKAQIDFFTFFIPYPTDILDDQFDIGHAAIDLINDDIETIISISINHDSSVIYYDHWEDGLETTLTAPTQSSTQVWGDNNPANGIPPNFVTDTLQTGDVIVLREVVTLPRDPTIFFPDGGDKVLSLGGPIAVTLSVWPINEPSPPEPEIGILYAGAWELYPTSKWGQEYRIPVGQDLAGIRPGFSVVGLNVQAVEDNTTVQLDLDANNSFEQTIVLNQGEQFTQIQGVNTGAYIRSDAQIQVHILSANPASNYEARAYSIVAFDQWTDELLAPRSSAGDFWLFNPDTLTLTIRVQSFTTTTFIDIPPNTTAKYPPNPAQLSDATGLYFSSTDGRPFFGVAALDDLENQDWGYALLPLEALTSQTIVGWGPGNNNSPPGPAPPPPPGMDGFESRIYVTALETTTVWVDFDNDPNTPNQSILISPLEEVAIVDPVDYDMSNAFLYTEDNTPFLAVWGQDDSAPDSGLSIDVGTGVIPFPSLLIQKTVNSLIDDIDCTGTATLGDIIQYKINYFNNSVNSVDNVTIEDTLPTEVAYVPNSVTLNGNSVADDSGSSTSFPLDEGGYNIGVVPTLGSGSLTFNTIINDPASSIINRSAIRSRDPTSRLEIAIIFTPVITPAQRIYEINTNVIDPPNGTATAGDVITFSVTITNTGALTITSFTLQNLFEESHLTFQQATPAPDTTAPGVIRWNDLTNNFGDLSVGGSISLTLQFVVDDIPVDVTDTTSEVIGAGGELSDGTDLPTCRGQAEVIFDTNPSPPETPTITREPSETVTVSPTPEETSTPTPAKTTTPEPSSTKETDDDDDEEQRTPPPPTPQVTPAGTPIARLDTPSPPGSTETLPVVLLPETGQPAKKLSLWPLAVMLLLGISILGWILYRRHLEQRV